MNKKRTEGYTNREKEVIEYLLLGFSNREIGEKTFVVEKSVKATITNILRKSGHNSSKEFISRMFMSLVSELESEINILKIQNRALNEKLNRNINILMQDNQ